MAVIECPNCGNEISDQASLCPNCKTTMSEIQAQNPKKKRTTPILVPILSVLDGLVLLGTVGLLTFGAISPEIMRVPTTENVVASADLGASCRAISTLHINAAKNYNAYHSDDPIVLPEPPAPVTNVASPDADESEPAEALLQEALATSEVNAEPVQNSTLEQTEQSTAPVSESPLKSVQTPASNTGASPAAQAPKPTTGSNGSYVHDFSGGRVLITKASNNNNDPVYHTKDCVSARKIASADEYWYDSAKDAENAGRRLCGNCSR